MRSPKSMKGLEELGRVRLSANFYMRDFLYSEIANFYAMPNIPDDPDLAIAAGKRLCEELLEPLNATFGRIGVRSGYRSPAINGFGNRHNLNCASNQRDAAYHIWDTHDRKGHTGATACIVIPWFADRYAKGADWRALAWWIHDHLPYGTMWFHPKLCALNLQWQEAPLRRIDSYIAPRGLLTRPGMDNWEGDHSAWYAGFPDPVIHRP